MGQKVGALMRILSKIPLNFHVSFEILAIRNAYTRNSQPIEFLDFDLCVELWPLKWKSKCVYIYIKNLYKYKSMIYIYYDLANFLDMNISSKTVIVSFSY